VLVAQPAEQFAAETNVAIAGQPYNISWQGGQLDLPVAVQV
jgi:hypothetical protein